MNLKLPATFLWRRVRRYQWRELWILGVPATAAWIVVCGVGLVRAADAVPVDFCYRLPFTVTNDTGSTITNYPVRFTVPAAGMIAADQLDERAWDLVCTTSGLDEVEVTVQELTDATGAWWLRAPSIANGSSVSYYCVTSNHVAKRDQGLILNAGTSATTTSHADFDITDELQIDLELELEDADAQAGTLLSRWDNDAGYRLMLADNGGLVIRGQIDGEALDVNWDSSWTQETIDIRMTFDAPWLTLYVDNTLGGTVDTTLGSITATSTAVVLGESTEDAVIRHAEILKDIASTASVVARWGMDPRYMDETSAVNPTYSGTIEDYGANDHDLTYAVTSSQTGITATLGALTVTSAPAPLDLDATGPDIVGDVFETDLFTSGTENPRLPFFPIFDEAADAMGIPRPMFWAGTSLTFGFLLALGVHFATRHVLYTSITVLMPLTLAVINRQVDPWFLTLWVLLVVGLLGANRFGRENT